MDKFGEILELEQELIRKKRDLLSDLSSRTLTEEEIQTGTPTFLIIQISKMLFAIPITCVDEVVQMPSTIVHPDRIKGVLGYVDYHGEILSIIDLNELLGNEPSVANSEKSLFIGSLKEHKFAMIIDEATDVITVEHEDIRIGHSALSGLVKTMGVIQVEGQSAIILDIWFVVAGLGGAPHGE